MKISNKLTYKEFTPLLNDCFPDESIDRITFETNIKKSNFIFVQINGKTCGYVLYDPTTYVARLIHICVGADYRGIGIGSTLMNELVNRLQEKGIDTITLTVDQKNERAIKLYEKLGFTKESTLYKYSIEYSYYASVDCKFTIELVTKEDKSEIMNKYTIGSSLLDYFITSKISIFYKVMNTDEDIVGYFVYDNQSNLITHFDLDNPQSTPEVVTWMHQIANPKEDLQIQFVNDKISEFIKNEAGVTLNFILYEMRYTLANPDNSN